MASKQSPAVTDLSSLTGAAEQSAEAYQCDQSHELVVAVESRKRTGIGCGLNPVKGARAHAGLCTSSHEGWDQGV